MVTHTAGVVPLEVEPSSSRAGCGTEPGGARFRPGGRPRRARSSPRTATAAAAARRRGASGPRSALRAQRAPAARRRPPSLLRSAAAPTVPSAVIGARLSGTPDQRSQDVRLRATSARWRGVLEDRGPAEVATSRPGADLSGSTHRRAQRPAQRARGHRPRRRPGARRHRPGAVGPAASTSGTRTLDSSAERSPTNLATPPSSCPRITTGTGVRRVAVWTTGAGSSGRPTASTGRVINRSSRHGDDRGVDGVGGELSGPTGAG